MPVPTIDEVLAAREAYLQVAAPFLLAAGWTPEPGRSPLLSPRWRREGVQSAMTTDYALAAEAAHKNGGRSTT